MRGRGYRRRGAWAFALALLAGVLGQACSSQDDPKGPGHPAGTTGSDDSGVFVQIAVNPNAVDVNDRAGITVLVTNGFGRPLEGRHVQLSTTSGELDRVDGFTDPDGKFVSFLLCRGSGTATITAFVLGVSGEADVVCGGATTTTTTTTTTTP